MCVVLGTAAPVSASGGEAAGVFDFEIVAHDGAYVLRDAAYEVTFPGKPNVKKQTDTRADGKPGDSMLASYAVGTEAYTFAVSPIPRDTAFPSKMGLDAARDEMVRRMQAKILSEAPLRVGRHEGRHLVATAVVQGTELHFDARLVWDETHRALLVMLVTNSAAGDTPAAHAFVGSLAIAGPGKGPLDEPLPADHSVTPAGVLDLTLAREGDTFRVRDDSLEIAFPDRPFVHALAGADPAIAFGAETYVRDVDYYMLGAIILPESLAYDVDKGLAGARDGALKMIEKQKRTETKAKVGGLAGRRVLVSGLYKGLAVHVEAVYAWDAKHHMVVMAIAMTPGKAMSPAGRAFLDSLVVHANGKTPHAP